MLRWSQTLRSDQFPTNLAPVPAIRLTSIESSSDSVPTPEIISDETLCSICANPIIDYVPKYFLGQKCSPACGNCDPGDTSDDDHEPKLPNDSDQPFTRIGLNFPRTSLESSSIPTSSCSYEQPCISLQLFPYLP